MCVTVENKLPIIQFRPEYLEYVRDDAGGYFVHNFNKDIHILILWEKGRYTQTKILEDIESKYKIINCYEVKWNEKNAHSNFQRLYDGNPSKESVKVKSVGAGKFLAVVLEDSTPTYVYKRDYGGRIKLVNDKLVESKRLYREWTGGGINVHCSDNIAEFFKNASLILGPEELRSCLLKESWNGEISLFSKDLVGASGWQTFDELFNVLNLSTPYVVLRNNDELDQPVAGFNDDVDILVLNKAEFVSAANAIKMQASKSGYRIKIGGKSIRFDVRVVGDGYYDERWQEHIVQRRVLEEGGRYVPRIDDHFFSLLYHAKLQKQKVKPIYLDRLTKLAAAIGMHDIDKDFILNDRAVAAVLSGYMRANSYRFCIPNDSGVYRNYKAIKELMVTRIYLGEVSLLSSIKLMSKAQLVLKIKLGLIEYIKRKRVLYAVLKRAQKFFKR